MLKLSKIEVYTMDLDSLNLWWRVDTSEGNTEDPLAYTFYLQRSESPGGPLDTLGGPFKDKWYYHDIHVNLRHRTRKYYYRMRVVKDSTAEEDYTDPATVEAETDLIGREIILRMRLLLTEFIGRKVILFPVRTFGTRCPDCWDTIRLRRTKDRCHTCFGVSFVGGYLSPMVIPMNIDPEVSTIQAVSTGEIMDVKSTARCLPFPPIKPNDVIVEAENTRWCVMNVSGTRRLRSTAHQELQLHQIFPGDIRFKVPVNLDLFNFKPSPGREFTNPQGPEALGPRDLGVENFFAAYGYPIVR